jgi:hypothetical protein
MNQTFYKSAIFFLGLIFVSAIFDRLMHQWMGSEVVVGEYSIRNSYSNWYLLENLVSSVGALFLIRYYHHKKYWIAFSTASILAISSLCFAVLVYILMQGPSDLMKLYLPMLFVNLGAGFVYSASVIFSNAGKRLWLRLAGISYGVAYGIFLSTRLYVTNSGNTFTATLENLNSAAAWIVVPAILFCILNFVDESKLVRNIEVRKSEVSEIWLTILGLACFGFTVTNGLDFVSQGYDAKHVPAKAKIIAMPFEPRSYVSKTGDTLWYRLMKPLNYDPQKKYPFVVCLTPFCSNDNVRQIKNCASAQWLAEEENRKKYPAFIFVPSCPKGTGWGAVPNTPTIEKLALEGISSVIKEPGIDAKRVYVMGNSRGGYGSWNFIGTRPDLFAAAIPMCGADEPALGKNMVNVAVWAFHGEKDKNVPVAGSRNLIAAIKNSGGSPRYTEYPDLEHSIWDEIKATPGLLDWLFAQKQK